MARCPLSQLVNRFKVLANPARLRILALLRQGELCVCQIVHILGAANSTISEHLQTLRQDAKLPGIPEEMNPTREVT